jgi:hypothetical protein
MLRWWDQLLSALWEGVSSGTMVVICTGQGDTAYTRYLQVRCWARCRCHMVRGACGCGLCEGLRLRWGEEQVHAVCTAASNLGVLTLRWPVPPACGPARPPSTSSAQTADVPAEVLPTLRLRPAGAEVPAAAAARRHACLDPRLRGVAGDEECTGSLRGLLCWGQIRAQQWARDAGAEWVCFHLDFQFNMNPHNSVCRIFGFVGLPWNPKCKPSVGTFKADL